MRNLFLILLILNFSSMSFARATSVRSYHKRSGAYVSPHKRSSANNSRYDNYSTKGNINPYTGKKGTRKP